LRVPACSLPVLYLFLLVLYLFFTCSVPALHLFCTCSAPVLHLFCTCSLPVLYLLCTCSAPVLHLFCTCSLPALYLLLSKIEFLPASEGVLVVTAYEGRNLKNMELIGTQDPYCKYTIGKKLKRRTRTVNKGGTNPFFNEEEVEFWIGKNDWGHPCVFSCLDEDVGSDDLIGGRRFSLLPFFTQTEPTHDWFEISNKGKPAGEVQLRFEFFPAGRLKIQCHAGRNLGKLVLHMTIVYFYFCP
jgi:hypothetical protein